MSEELCPLDQLLAMLAPADGAPGPAGNSPQEAEPHQPAPAVLPDDSPPAPRLTGRRGRGPRLVKLSMAAEPEGGKRAQWTRRMEKAVDLPPAGLAERLFVLEGPAGSRAAFHCLSADDGETLWSVPLKGDAPGQFTIDRARAYLWTAADELTAIDLAGGEAALTNGKGVKSASDRQVSELQQQIENRDQVIGELTIANRILKKLSGQSL